MHDAYIAEASTAGIALETHVLGLNAVALVGDDLVRRHEHDLRTAAVAFRLRAAGLLRVALSRRS